MMAAQLQLASGSASSGGSLGDKPAPSLGGATVPAEQPPVPPPEPVEPLRSRIGGSSSPFVRAQAQTPVQWQPLDQEAVDRAKKENKLIFLHVGYLACHYCHVTTQDAFTHPSIVSLLNESFIPIVIDRDERPDVDGIYWNYLQLVNSSAGWPLNVFLTPELEPVFGGSFWPGPGSEEEGVRGGGGGGGGGGGSGGDDHDHDEDNDEGEALFGFLAILQKLKDSWTEREGQCRAEAKDTLEQLRKFVAEGTLGPRGLLPPAADGDASGTSSAAAEPAAYLAADLDLDIDQLDEAYTQLKKTFDPVNGGFGVVPKFVTPAKYAFLLQLGSLPPVVQDIVGAAEVGNVVQMALYTLRKLANSGLNDHLAGGFARASHTINWTLPYFEKLVADNGLLLGLYLDAWLYSQQQQQPQQPQAGAEFLSVVYALGDYLSSAPVRLAGGGFATSEAADSCYRKGSTATREGAYYVWTRREFDTVVSGKGEEDDSANDMDARVAAAHWNVLQHGNVERENDPLDEFMNQNVLHVSKDADELARQFGIPREDVQRITAAARAKLAAFRARERVRPVLDAKAVAATNGIVLGALARAGAALQHVAGADGARGAAYLGAARDAARFVRSALWDADARELYRTHSNGVRGPTRGFAEDYAFVVEGLLDLYEATAEAEWLQWADELQQRQIDLFYDAPATPATATHSSSGGFYRTRDGAPFALVRLKDGMDTTLPATNGVAAANLFRLGSLLGDAAYSHRARETIHAFEVEMTQHAWLFPTLLAQVVPARLGGRALAVVVPAAEGAGGADGADGAGSGPLPFPVLAAYFRQPRAGLRSLAHVPASSASSASSAAPSWLATRNPALARLAAEHSGGGVFVQNKDQWDEATPADLVVRAEDGA